jgi:hypothetical protein
MSGKSLEAIAKGSLGILEPSSPTRFRVDSAYVKALERSVEEMQCTIKRIRRENLDLRSHMEATSSIECRAATEDKNLQLASCATMPYKMTCRGLTCLVKIDDQMRRSSKTKDRFPHFKGVTNCQCVHVNRV